MFEENYVGGRITEWGGNTDGFLVRLRTAVEGWFRVSS